MLARDEILGWLRETDAARLEALWRRADEVRAAHVGDAVYLRGLIEVSNICARDCHYCGIRAGRRDIPRYRMTADEIMACAQEALRLGYGTVVMQSGEDCGITQAWMADVIRRIKAETGLTVTLSLGERRDAELVAWRAAGADRYLMRFETSNADLYARIHPDHGRPSDRMALLRRLREIGYEVGSGVMVGIPGQRYADLANDLAVFAALDLDMIGIGPYLPHPDTPLGSGTSVVQALPADEQVPNTEEMTLKMVALTRLMCPWTNIPSTTALATINVASGREHGLQRGANIVMPNLTPPAYRCQYEIYPGKACIHETAAACQACLQRRIAGIGRHIGKGPGASLNLRRRAAATR